MGSEMCIRDRFTVDSRFLFCDCLPPDAGGAIFRQCFGISVDAKSNFSLDVTDFPLKLQQSEPHSVGGFLLGDPLTSEKPSRSLHFVLSGQSLLRNPFPSCLIEMTYRNKLTESTDDKYLPVESLAFFLTGEAIYMIVSSAFSRKRIMAWDVSNWKLKAEKEFSTKRYVNAGLVLAVLRRGVMIATLRTLELWNLKLSYCIRQWSLDVMSLFTISDDQVLCTTFPNAEEIIVDTVTGDIVPAFATSSFKLIACYRNFHLLASTGGLQSGCIKLQQLGQSAPRWELSLPYLHVDSLLGCFSPKGQYILVRSMTGAHVLDVVSGNELFKLSDFDNIYNLKFISDEEFVILSYHFYNGGRLRLFSAWSGHLLSVLHVYCANDHRCCLATFPGEGLIAICSPGKFNVEVIKVKLSEGRRNASGIAKG